MTFVPVLLFRFLFKFWPPFWFTGIRLKKVSKDWRFVRVEMPLRFYNKNIIGIHFGGSLYSMVDPWYMMMIYQNIGSEYRVVDHSATVNYLAPGRGLVFAEFNLTIDEITTIKQLAANGEKVLRSYTVLVKNTDQETVCEIVKTIYIRKRQLPAA